MTDSTTFKVCPRCTEDKLLTEFGIDHRNRDGRHSHCLECRREHAALKRRARRDVTGTGNESTTLRHPRCAAQEAAVGGISESALRCWTYFHCGFAWGAPGGGRP